MSQIFTDAAAWEEPPTEYTDITEPTAENILPQILPVSLYTSPSPRDRQKSRMPSSAWKKKKKKKQKKKKKKKKEKKKEKKEENQHTVKSDYSKKKE